MTIIKTREAILSIEVETELNIILKDSEVEKVFAFYGSIDKSNPYKVRFFIDFVQELENKRSEERRVGKEC